MKKKGSWRELKVWQLAHEFVIDIYKNTANFPKEEIYGLTSQLRRAAVSVPSNIVEGNSRRFRKEYINFLYVSRGSLEEARYQLFLSQELTFLPAEIYNKLEEQAVGVSILLNRLIDKLEATS